MPRRPDSGQIDLTEVFHRVQQEMLAQLAVGRLFEHASAAGAATEHHWLDLFDRYLPKRYRVTPAFVIDSAGRRSRQIDIAIFDNLYSPLLFPHASGFHIPAESVYAVFEVKPTFSRQWLRDAAEKAASVRALHRTSVPVIAGGTNVRPFAPSRSSPASSPPAPSGTPAPSPPTSAEPSHLSTTLSTSAAASNTELSNTNPHPPYQSTRTKSLIFFILRLLERLRAMGTAPAADLMLYARTLRSFRK